MSRKSKGTNAERDLTHKFWEHNWAAVRVAGSGSNKYPSPDILVGKGDRRFVIECKTSKEKFKYLTKNEVRELQLFAHIFGAEPRVAIKFNNVPWYFLNIEQCIEKDASYFVDYELLTAQGLSFDRLIEKNN